ncbi:LysR family transcriptional regulator [Yinghuangia seranimata]|uniref:LysR family transcriptional regulator n=1 Tax=Yinghuangia seranimata TaxID=408067 RepID=UPI00248B648C|nr:LysR family transcriptional regulator [Yinghuangia seranimata]MDI2130954.1 LysR family transcriptional regulator [Yinghuangia seranimata]
MTYESRSSRDAEPENGVGVLAPRLVQFAAVARAEHVTRAAEALDIPQPTLSRTVARLERELGVPLLVRTGRGVRLTRQGRTLLAAVEPLLDRLEEACAEIQGEVSATRGKVAFGFLHTMGGEAVPGLLRDFRADHPGIRFALVQDAGPTMLVRMRAGDLDLCITSPLPDDPNLAVHALDEQRLYLVVPADHRLAGRRRVRLAEAAGEPFVCMGPGYGLRRITDALCAEAGFVPQVAFEGEEADTLRGLVAAGLGVALLPAPDEGGRAGTVHLEVTEPRAYRTLALSWPADRPQTAPVRLFRDFVLGRTGRLLAE